MYSIPSYYELGSCSNSVNYLQGVLSSSRSRPMTTTTTTNTNNMGNYSSTSISMLVSSKSQPPPPPQPAEEKAAAASKSHSEAERRRRKRINGHLATLRSLLPNTIKTDKASLLAEVVRRLRELKKTTAEELAVSGGGSNNRSSSSSSTISSDTSSESSQSRGGGGGCGGAQPPTPKQHNMLFPSEADELKLCYSEGDSSTASTIIKATLCCEDRPELMSDMTRAVRSVEGKVVRAEMATVGGRTKSILWVQLSVSGSTAAGGGGGGGDEGGGIGRLRRALKVVLDRTALPPGWGLQALPENKRPRLSQY